MTKKVALLTILSIIVITLIFNLIKNKQANFNETKEEVKNSNILTMMLETEAGTGIYEETTASEWPIDGYIFNETLSKCENGGTLSWDDDNKKVIVESNTSNKCYVYFDIANQTFADYIINEVYTEDGSNGLYYHDGIGTYTNANQEAGDNSYRYSGTNPNNYVCFGSNVTTCPNDNLYRIIGIFDDDQDGTYNVKLIKNSSIGKYAWDSGRSNTWNETEKPDMYATLNTTYWNTLSNEWQSLIDETRQWQVGGMVWSSTNTAKQYYNVEIKNQTGYEETMAVGLMYISDYGYSASPDNWQTALFKYNNTNNNWLYSRGYEWTNSRRSDDSDNVFLVHGIINCDYAHDEWEIRPSFYLKSEVILEGGTGASADPYRISL